MPPAPGLTIRVNPEGSKDLSRPLEIGVLAAPAVQGPLVMAAGAGLHGLFEPDTQRGVRHALFGLRPDTGKSFGRNDGATMRAHTWFIQYRHGGSLS